MSGIYPCQWLHTLEDGKWHPHIWFWPWVMLLNPLTSAHSCGASVPFLSMAVFIWYGFQTFTPHHVKKSVLSDI